VAELGLTLDAAAFHYNHNLQTVNPYFVDDELIVEIDNAARRGVRHRCGRQPAGDRPAESHGRLQWLLKRNTVHRR
jgi:hypothetical protein